MTEITEIKKPLTEGERAIRWIEDNLYQFNGPRIGKKVILYPFQRECVIDILDNPKNPGVRCRMGILTFPRRNGKSALVSFLACYFLMGPGALPNTNIVSAARSAKQSKIIFDYMRKSILFSPRLRRICTFNGTDREIRVPGLGTMFRSVANKPEALHGLGIRVCFIDETGEIKNETDPSVEALSSAQGAEDKPLMIHLSTQAADDQSLFSLLLDDAKASSDPTIVVKQWSCPDDHPNPFSAEALKIANPAWDLWIDQEFLLALAAEAERMPSKQGTFRQRYLNQRTSAEAKYIAPALWKACEADPGDWEGKDVYLGIDLSSTTDLSSFGVVWQCDPNDAAILGVKSFSWLPDDTLKEMTTNDRRPYDVWKKKGILLTTPGRTINYKFLATKIKEIDQKANIKKIGFDRAKVDELKRAMDDIGYSDRWIEEKFFEVYQNFTGFANVLDAADEYILNGKVRHGNNPLLTMAFNNAKVIADHNNNRKIVKMGGNRRIDPCVAAVQAIYTFNRFYTEKPKRTGVRVY